MDQISASERDKDRQDQRAEARHGDAEGSRPETGVLRFGDDWPGYFMRGDSAVAFAIRLESVMSRMMRGETVALHELQELKQDAWDIGECDQSRGSNPQQVKPWDECVAKK